MQITAADSSMHLIENNLETFFIDMMFKYQGFAAMVEYANKKVVNNPFGDFDFDFRESLVDINGRSYYTGNGINAQISYLFRNNIEVATRYTQVMPNTDVSFTGVKEYTLGLSKYVVGHSLKVQADVSLIDKEGASDNKLRYRLQTELAF